jgi:hypothetical protein
MNTNLKKRIQSFAWRFGGLSVVSILAFTIQPDIAEALALPHYLVVIIGLVANEITKWLNSSSN